MRAREAERGIACDRSTRTCQVGTGSLVAIMRPSELRPLPFVVWLRWSARRSRQRAGRGARRRRSALRADCPAAPAHAGAGACARHETVRRDCFVSGRTASPSWPAAQLAALPSVAPQTGAASQSTRRASRAARRAALLGASHARPGRPAAGFADTAVVFEPWNTTAGACRGRRVPSPGSRGGASGHWPVAGDMEGEGTRRPRLARCWHSSSEFKLVARRQASLGSVSRRPNTEAYNASAVATGRARRAIAPPEYSSTPATKREP